MIKELSSSGPGPGQVKVMRRSDEVKEGQKKGLDLSYTIFFVFFNIDSGPLKIDSSSTTNFFWILALSM